MGLGSVIQGNASMVRAASEQCLLVMEDMKRVRAGSTLTSARTRELDSIADEARGSALKSVEAFFQAQSAKEAEIAAIAGLVSAIAGAGAAIAKASEKDEKTGKRDAVGIVSEVIKGCFSALGALFAVLGAHNERELADNQARTMSDEAKEDAKHVATLDGNPTK